ncbi:MAG: hypothetical protein GXP36_01080 [Actinobacteria bacterium]|nr:hypothetical protein [Actinomycetota bacterium]
MSGLSSVQSPGSLPEADLIPAQHLTTLQLPLPWETFGFPSQWVGRSVHLVTGDPAWSWSETAPTFNIPAVEDTDTALQEPTHVAGWAVDHVVLLVPSLDEAIVVFAEAGLDPRLQMKVKGRPAAFFRAGPLVEVVESPVRNPAIYGVTLVCEEPLEGVALRWRAMGLNISTIQGAIQPGRRIFSVHDTEAGFAVMSADKAVH